MAWLWRNKKQTGRAIPPGDGLAADPAEAPARASPKGSDASVQARRRPAGILQPSPVPSQPHLQVQNERTYDQASHRGSPAQSGDQACSQAAQAWRKKEARLASRGEEDPGALSPIFEIKQTADLQAEQEALEAAALALQEAEHEALVQHEPEDGGFAKKSGGFMSRWLSRKKDPTAAVDDAIAAADARDTTKSLQHATQNAPQDAADAAGLPPSMPEDDQGFRRVPSKGSQASMEVENDLYPPPPPDDEDEEDTHNHQQGAGRTQKHDPSRERRRVAFDLEPRSFERWKGLGLFDTVEESNTVQMRRAAEVSAETKVEVKKEAVMRGVATINRLGALHLNVMEAKGIPKHNDDGSSTVFVTVRLFSSEFTTKPDYEHETPKVYEKDTMVRSLKVKWFADFAIDVRHRDAWLECEICIDEGSRGFFGIGSHRMRVQEIEDEKGEAVENWYSLKRKDGSAASAAIHISARYEKEDNDPKTLAIKNRAEREALMADAMPDIPDWISAWDVRCVRQFQESIAVARKAVVDALDADTLASLRKGKTLVDEFSLNDEANSKELVARLKELEEEEAAQNVMRKKIRELLLEPRTRVFFLQSSMQKLLLEASALKLTNTCEEVVQGLELLSWCNEAIKAGGNTSAAHVTPPKPGFQVTGVPGAPRS